MARGMGATPEENPGGDNNHAWSVSTFVSAAKLRVVIARQNFLSRDRKPAVGARSIHGRESIILNSGRLSWTVLSFRTIIPMRVTASKLGVPINEIRIDTR
jgi:hypothetical protein